MLAFLRIVGLCLLKRSLTRAAPFFLACWLDSRVREIASGIVVFSTERRDLKWKGERYREANKTMKKSHTEVPSVRKRERIPQMAEWNFFLSRIISRCMINTPVLLNEPHCSHETIKGIFDLHK